MTKYNTPRDTQLLEQISQLKKRVDRLERFTSATSLLITSAVPAAEFDTPTAVTSGTFANTHTFNTVVSANTPIVRLLATCTDGSTAGEFRLVDAAGTVLTGPDGQQITSKVIPAGTTTETAFENDMSPNYHTGLAIGTDVTYHLQVRRTAGAGTINVRVKYLVQVPR